MALTKLQPTHIDHLVTSDQLAWYRNQRKNIRISNLNGDRVPVYHIGQSRSAFLILSGPTLKQLDLTLLNTRGIVTMGVNNSPAAMVENGSRMPDYWVSVDSPKNFIEHIWKDPTVCKFVPSGHQRLNLRVRNSEGELIKSQFMVEQMPNVLYYNRNKKFDPSRYLVEEEFNWGSDDGVSDTIGVSGARSVMLVALKMLYALGFSKVYLVGATFKMESEEQPYAFSQLASAKKLDSNNNSYAGLTKRFTSLLPYFEKAGFEVFNCTPETHLKVFPEIPFEEAIASASKEVNEKPIQTEGYYDKVPTPGKPV